MNVSILSNDRQGLANQEEKYKSISYRQKSEETNEENLKFVTLSPFLQYFFIIHRFEYFVSVTLLLYF